MFLVHPESSYRLVWDIVTAFFVLVLIWLVPMYIGFTTWETPTFLVHFGYVMDIWFITDVILNFRTGYVDHGATEMDPKKIAQNYVSSWFLIDFFASIPWEYILASGESISDTMDKKSARKSLKLSKYFKIPKLLRMARLLRAFNKYARFYALTLVILTMVATLHIGACLMCSTLAICEEYYLIDYDNTNTLSWESNDNQSVCGGEGVYHLYAEAIYVTFSLLIGMSATGGTLGQDNWVKQHRGVSITQAMKSQHWKGGDVYMICLCLMVAGIMELALVIGHIGLLLRDRYLASAAYRAKLDRVKEELKYYGVPWLLQNRVLAYYDYMWVNQKQYDDKITLLTDKGMSSDLRGKLALHLYKDVVQGVSLFSRVDDTFLSKVCMELQTRVFLPADWIILKGDIGSELYIISRGVCEVFLRDPWEKYESSSDLMADAEGEEILLSNGQFFGEISLLMEVRRTTSVQAKTICEVNVLVQEIFEEILRESPDFADEMKSLIVQRKVENFKKLQGQTATEEDQMMIEEAVEEAIESRQLLSLGQHEEISSGDRDTISPTPDNKSDNDNRDDRDDRDDRDNHDNHDNHDDDNELLPGMLNDDGEGDEKHDFEFQINSNKLFPNPSRSLHDRSASGLVLGNVGGTGFIDQPTTAVIQEKIDRAKEKDETRFDETSGLNLIAKKPSKLSPKANSPRRLSVKAVFDGINNGSGESPTSSSVGAMNKRNSVKSGGRNASLQRQGTRADFYSSLNNQLTRSGEGDDIEEGAEYAADEVVSQQLSLLQERIDKIYAMLTTKLGRVR